MKSPEKMNVSFSAAATVFAIVASVVLAAGFLPAKSTYAAAPEAATSVKQDIRSGGFSVKDWEMLVKSL